MNTLTAQEIEARRVFLVLLLALLPALFASLPALADLVNPTVLTDAPLTFEAQVGDTALGAATVGGAVTNWNVTVLQGTFDGGAANDDILIFGQHGVAPHLNELAPNPNLVIGIVQNVVPGAAGGAVFLISRSHGPDHFDNVHVTYAPGAAGSVLSITIEHQDTEGTVDDPPFPPPSEPPTVPPEDGWQSPEFSVAIPALTGWGVVLLIISVGAAGMLLINRLRLRDGESRS